MERIITKVKISAPALPRKKRVAAYARVSSGKDAMLHSLSAQISYYSNFIQHHGDWEYVGVYTDEALTGTKDSRAEFQHLLSDCRNGKIDMVITKSISRFARNTVTMLETVRELRLLNIDVFFEKENIHSLSGDGELMLTILASFAQEESRSVSENCKWRIRRQFADGRPGSTTMLGYKWVDGTLQMIPEEAETVRIIFSDYLSGMGKNAIMKKLNASRIPTKCGGAWCESGVAKILDNEKYAGDLLLQKSYSSNYMEKKKCMNRGQLPMYFVKDSHEPIIDRETFERVQKERKRRAAGYLSINKETYPFTGKVQCGCCGKNYRRKIANAGSKYASPVWICSTFNSKGKAVCSSKQIPEDILTAMTTDALGLSEFDEAVFIGKIKQIVMCGPDKMLFIFHDGRQVEKTWQNKSRRDSWDDAARQRAREMNERRNNPWQQQQEQ
ncbi:recombinase family protein [Caproicibacterium sp. BJN0003]|uniref:recombinase family protein n=1 Tax=Caproicibacterium sp. BJN0003 TaxID=2994078 RepID=UPI0022544263|nr:recombinase family protein [Caproicibacterium sp. BJN0003]UZT81571.1 recombinase family protein [Caproicibacterium sp. BJN0003]